MLLTFFLIGMGQEEEWNVTDLSPLPMHTTFNTIVEANVGNEKFVYSFSGVKDTLLIDSLHNHIFKYNVADNEWVAIDALQDTTNTITRKAVFLNNRIYLFGGYFFDDNDELVLDGRTIIYNPFFDTLEASGAAMPTPIIDQVTVKWRDSLIYNIGGINSQGEYNTSVQVYNPYFDSWSLAEQIPNNDFFKHAGACGFIIEDTIYYFGGVSGTFLPTTNGYLRKGIIDPDNPLNINWVFEEEYELAKSYNASCSGFVDKLFVFGGSREGYDFFGEDTVNNEPALPRGETLNYFIRTESAISQFPEKTKNGVIGIAKMGGGNWISAGGLDSLGQVSNRTILLNNKDFSSITQLIVPPFFEVNEGVDSYIILTENIGTIRVYDLAGRLLFNTLKSLSNLVIPKSDLPSDYLLFVYDDGSNVPVVRRKVLIK
jgi:hypothetical protein